MTLHTHRLRDAIVLALAGSAWFSTAALAQEASGQDNKTEELDRIEVTGTRIRQVDIETAAPVLTISRADIEKQGFQSVSDILQNISAMGAPPLTRAQPLSAGEAAGGTFISLRNLGAARTLVLLNGRRLGVTTSGLADTSTIPAIAIERIEVLKDGASAIYGSDAIGGVVNIITRTNYDGARASAYFGQYSEGDGATTRADFAMGFTGERGALSMGAEWGKEEKVAASDRPYSAFPRSDIHPTDGWTTVHAGGGYVRGGTRVVLRPGGNSRNPADFVPQNVNTGSCSPAAGASATNGCVPGSILDKTNTNEQTDLRTPQEYRGLFVDGIYDISDQLRFRTNLLYSNRVTDRQVAGYPMQAAAFNTPLDANSYFNPTPGTAIGNWWRRTWEVPRVSTSDLTVYRFVGAFEGSFDFADRTFDWDVSYFHNQNKLEQSAYGNLNLANVRAAVGPSFLNAQGQVQCGTAASPIALANCVPWNPFLGFGVSGQGALSGNTALRDFLFQEEHSTGETSTTVMAANLAGTLFSLPAGDLNFAVGYEHRKERGKFVPDSLAVTGGSTNLAAGPTRGSYSVDEFYAELQVPILADVAFARSLSLDIASRFSDYDTFGKTTNNKLGLKWKPIDSLLLRATVADGFRAPTIADLYGGGSQTFPSFTDPCDTSFGSAASNATTRQNCINGVGGNGALGALGATFRQLGQGFVPAGGPNTQTPVAFNTGSNVDLKPEVSKSQTIGAAWSPSFVEGLFLSLDWWKIRIDDTIVQDTTNQILNDCYVQGIASRCASALFTRDATRGYVNFAKLAGINAGFRKVEGFDFDVSYRLKTERFGDFRVQSNTTYTVRDYLLSTNDPRKPLSNVGITSTFRVRSNLNLGWEKGAWGVNWFSRYYSSMKENCTYSVAGATSPNLECNEIGFAPTGALTGTTSAIARRNRMGSNTFHDLQVRWNAPWDAVISVGANNVFDHVGPVMYTQPSSNVSYYGGFDIGRFWYVKYTQKF
jgi:iron complex outermembrane receptor protein